MKGDFAEHLEMPVMEPDDNRPAREYVNPASIRLHSILFLLIAVTVAAAMLFVLQVATSTSTVNRIAVTDGQTNGARGVESPTVDRIGPATSENGSAALDGQGRTIAIVEGPAPSGGQPQDSTDFPEAALFLLAITSGAAGAAIHALTALATYAGNRQLVSSWLPWIYLRIPIGVLLSILVYLGLRAGIFDTSYMRGEGGVFAVAFVCAISGLFSKQVTDKLSDLIDNLLVPASKPARGDSLEDVAHGSGASAEVVQPQGVPEETIQAVQRNLIVLGYLRETNDQGTPADDGIVGTSTHDAIESFLSNHGIVGHTRAATLGEETGPDYWPNLLDLLGQEVKTKNNEVVDGHSADS